MVNNYDIGHSDYCDGIRDEDGNCPLCEARHEQERRYWRPLYEGEKRAGMLDMTYEESWQIKHGWRKDFK